MLHRHWHESSISMLYRFEALHENRVLWRSGSTSPTLVTLARQLRPLHVGEYHLMPRSLTRTPRPKSADRLCVTDINTLTSISDSTSTQS
jgi:CHASE2 domain-containing sensor protein